MENLSSFLGQACAHQVWQKPQDPWSLLDSCTLFFKSNLRDSHHSLETWPRIIKYLPIRFGHGVLEAWMDNCMVSQLGKKFAIGFLLVMNIYCGIASQKTRKRQGVKGWKTFCTPPSKKVHILTKEWRKDPERNGLSLRSDWKFC